MHRSALRVQPLGSLFSLLHCCRIRCPEAITSKMLSINNNVRIQRRIRSRRLYWPQKIFLLMLLACLVGQQPTGEAAVTTSEAEQEETIAPSMSKIGWGRALKKKPKEEPKMTMNQILRKAGKKGLGGGIPGAIAGVVQVLSLMWLR